MAQILFPLPQNFLLFLPTAENDLKNPRPQILGALNLRLPFILFARSEYHVQKKSSKTYRDCRVANCETKIIISFISLAKFLLGFLINNVKKS